MSDPIVATAEAYPFALPEGSFALCGHAGGEIDLASRLPLLCIGSNAAPERLSAKLAGDPDPVPVLEAVLHDHAVVYAAHFARYGSVPATLIPHPGARARVFVAFVTPAQLELLDESEGLPERYRRVVLRARLELAGAPPPSTVHASAAARGPLMLAGRPVCIAEIPTIGTTPPGPDPAGAPAPAASPCAGAGPYGAFAGTVVQDADARFKALLANASVTLPAGG